MKLEWISLIFSAIALTLSYINYLHQIKPSIKIVSVENISGYMDVITIEVERLKHGYHLYSAETICKEKSHFIDYGYGNYILGIPRYLAAPSRIVKLNYWINPETPSDYSHSLFWFAVAQTDHSRKLKLKFRSISFPYRANCTIPIIDSDTSII